ncbi:MAG: flippase [Caldilineaceae bacterium]
MWWQPLARQQEKIEFMALLIARLKHPSQFIQQVSSTLVIQVLLLVLSTINAAVVARVLGAEGKGVLQLTTLVPSMLGLFLSGGLSVANVHYIGTKRFTLAALTANAMMFALILTLFGFVIVWLSAILHWLEFIAPGVPLWLLLIALAGFPLSLLQGYLNALLQGLQQIFTLNVLSLINGLLNLGLTLIFVLGFQQGVLGAVYALLITNAISLVLLYIILRRQGGVFVPKWNKEVMKATAGLGLRGHVGNILYFFNYRLDVFIVNYFLGLASVGIYGVGTKMAELVWYFPNAVGFVIFPKAAATSAQEMNRFTPLVFRMTLALSAVAGVGIALVGRPLINLLYTNAFDGAYAPLVALLPGVVLLGSARVLTNDIAGRGYPQYNSINAALALVLTVIFDFLLIPRMGILGAGIASSIAYSITFLSALLFYQVVSRQSDPAAAIGKV